MMDDLIEKMARQARCQQEAEALLKDQPALQRLVELVAEECALIAEMAPDTLQDSTFDGLARAIRARFKVR